MSSWGRCQNALWDVLWGYEDGDGNQYPGPLRDLKHEQVSEIIKLAIEAVYPIAFDMGQRSATRET